MPPRKAGLIKKSNENWKAAGLCRTNNHLNSATSRYYYALYEAALYWVWDPIDYDPKHPPKDVHATMASIIKRQCGARAQQLCNLLNNLKEQRITADYYPEPVDFENDVAELVEQAVEARTFFMGPGAIT